MSNRKTLLDRASSVAVTVACTAIVAGIADQFYKRPRLPVALSVPSEPLAIDVSTALGSTSARVGLVEFSDFQCPYCGSFARDVMPLLAQDYVAPGKLLVVFKHMPLPNHQFAQKAAEAAECAGRQGRMWQMHDSLFRDQTHLESSDLSKRASALGLDMPRFGTCLNGEAAAKIAADNAAATELGVTGTPAFFFGYLSARQPGSIKVAHVVSGAKSASDFRLIIDKLLSAAMLSAGNAN